jgi:TfoX/Sxy family transcriptional regulator of competence genes
MASNPDFVQYIADQCAGAGEIMVKKMFGDYGISCNSCYQTYGHRCVFN